MSATTKTPFIQRVQLRNYKSLGWCDVELGPLTVLVGRNGAGKSNFLDALRFLADSLNTSLDHAIKFRGGIDAVRRRSTGHPRNFAIALEMRLDEWSLASYAFEIAARPSAGFVVRHEHLAVRDGSGRTVAAYRVEDGQVSNSDTETMPPASIDRLYLVNAAGLPKFRAVYDGLRSMGFYNLNPEAMKELRAPDAGELLHRDGANVASVIGRMTTDKPNLKTRVKEYLSTIVPEVREFERVPLGPRETLEFRQEVEGASHPWKFYAASMSDGTLRALGTLIAVTQLAERHDPVRLVAIEEPETALHPAAAAALMNALEEATGHTQVLVTTHSPELLDNFREELGRLLCVVSKQGTTEIAPADPASVTAIRQHLYSVGELLRMDQLQPDEADLQRQRQGRLFDSDSTGDM